MLKSPKYSEIFRIYSRVHRMRPEWICRLQTLCSTWHRVITSSAENVHMESLCTHGIWASVMAVIAVPSAKWSTMWRSYGFHGVPTSPSPFRSCFLSGRLVPDAGSGHPMFFHIFQLHSTSFNFRPPPLPGLPISSNFTSPNECWKNTPNLSEPFRTCHSQHAKQPSPSVPVIVPFIPIPSHHFFPSDPLPPRQRPLPLRWFETDPPLCRPTARCIAAASQPLPAEPPPPVGFYSHWCQQISATIV